MASADLLVATPVESSNIENLGYNASTGTLQVGFRNGAIRHYYDVPDHLFARLMTAESKGRLFNAEVKGKFRSLELTGRCPKCGALGLVDESCVDCGCDTVRRVEKRYERAS